MLRTSIDKIKENGFKLTKDRSRRYPPKTITDTGYSDDIALLANAHAQAETLLHSLERVAAGIGLHVSARKTEYMCFNQTGDISTLNGSSLKLVDKFPYLGSSVSSTEKDIDTQLAKALLYSVFVTLSEVKRKNKNKLAKKRKEKEPTDAERTEKKEQRKMLELKEVKRKKKKKQEQTSNRKEKRKKKIVS